MRSQLGVAMIREGGALVSDVFVEVLIVSTCLLTMDSSTSV